MYMYVHMLHSQKDFFRHIKKLFMTGEKSNEVVVALLTWPNIDGSLLKMTQTLKTSQPVPHIVRSSKVFREHSQKSRVRII